MTLQEVKTKIQKKTWKREVGALLLGFLCYLALDIGNLEMVRILVYPFVAFAAMGFGLDWKGKYDGVAK